MQIWSGHAIFTPLCWLRQSSRCWTYVHYKTLHTSRMLEFWTGLVQVMYINTLKGGTSRNCFTQTYEIDTRLQIFILSGYLPDKYRDIIFWQTYRQTYIQTQRQADRHSGRQTGRQTNRKAGRQREQTDVQTERQAGRQTAARYCESNFLLHEGLNDSSLPATKLSLDLVFL